MSVEDRDRARDCRPWEAPGPARIIGHVDQSREHNQGGTPMQAFGAYASASVDLAAFAPPRRSQRSERKPEVVADTARGLLASIRRALAPLAGQNPPITPRLDAYPY
jgi:hypothetical protein